VKVDYIRGGSCEFWEHPRAHAFKCLSLRRVHLYENLPYNLNPVEVCQMANLWCFVKYPSSYKNQRPVMDWL
jgi:hypothetical protein